MTSVKSHTRNGHPVRAHTRKNRPKGIADAYKTAGAGLAAATGLAVMYALTAVMSVTAAAFCTVAAGALSITGVSIYHIRHRGRPAPRKVATPWRKAQLRIFRVKRRIRAVRHPIRTLRKETTVRSTRRDRANTGRKQWS